MAFGGGQAPLISTYLHGQVLRHASRSSVAAGLAIMKL
jgi:hypothetical protein